MKLTTRIWHVTLIKLAKLILCWQGKNFPLGKKPFESKLNTINLETVYKPIAVHGKLRIPQNVERTCVTAKIIINGMVTK